MLLISFVTLAEKHQSHRRATVDGDIEADCFDQYNCDSNCQTLIKGVTPFTLFGSDEIHVSDIKVYSLIFGGETRGIGVVRKNNESFFAAYEDVNGDEFLDLVVKVKTNAFAGVAPTEPFEVFGSLNDGTQVVFGLNEGESINFI